MKFGLNIDDRRLDFSCAHFLTDHETCGFLHGHNYRVKIDVLGDIGPDYMVIDYAKLRETIRKVSKEIDHMILIPGKSSKIEIKNEGDNIIIYKKDGDKKIKLYSFPKDDVVILPIEATTTELLARYFYEKLSEIMKNVGLRITIQESEGSLATYPMED